LRQLYHEYKNGSISECYFEGELVYIAGENWADAPSFIYDEDGNEIAECNYAWRQVDEMCGELKTARQSIASRIIFGDNLRLTNMDLESYSEVMNLSRTTTLFA